jgi:hypothetical protein
MVDHTAEIIEEQDRELDEIHEITGRILNYAEAINDTALEHEELIVKVG